MRRALRLVALGALVGLGGFASACHPHASPKTAKRLEAGVSIAMYDQGKTGYSVVDDRRWIDLAGSSVLLSNIDPGADLASLVLDPIDASLKIGSCTRERLPDVMSPEAARLEEYMRRQQQLEAERRARLGMRNAPLPPPPAAPRSSASNVHYAPVVRCEMKGASGRYLVRILYVSSTLRYRAQHDIEVTDPTRATVASRFAIITPPWRERADVVLFDGVPGGEHAPVEITRGSIELDGATAVLSVPMHDVKAQLRRVYDGAVLNTDDSRDATWGQTSMQAVWVWLELAGLHLSPGPVHVHLDVPGEAVRDIDVVAETRKQPLETPDAPLRLPLWIDEDLRGMRARTTEYDDGHTLSERLVVSIGNMGETARDVFVEEHLRTAAHRKIERAWPKKPTGAPGEILRNKLTIEPGKVVRAGYQLSYEF